MFRQAVSLDPNFVWCCNPRCEAGQVHESGANAPIVICHSCNSRACFVHQVAWHEGLICEEFDNPELAEERRRRELNMQQALRNQKRNQEEQVRLQIQDDEALARNLEEREAPRGEEEGTRRQKSRGQTAEARMAQRQVEAERFSRLEAERLAMEQLQEEHQRRQAGLAKQKQRRREEKLGESVVLESSKQCPGPRCSYRVSRAGGCKHMSCKALIPPYFPKEKSVSPILHVVFLALILKLVRHAIPVRVVLELWPTLGQGSLECCMLALLMR